VVDRVGIFETLEPLIWFSRFIRSISISAAVLGGGEGDLEMILLGGDLVQVDSGLHPLPRPFCPGLLMLKIRQELVEILGIQFR
jgi:hypothetical protein